MERAGATSRRETPVIVQYRAETLAEIAKSYAVDTSMIRASKPERHRPKSVTYFSSSFRRSSASSSASFNSAM